MSSRNFRRERDNRVLTICGVSILVLGIGYFMVENLSKRETPPLGMTFNIIVGFLLIFIAVIVLAVTLKTYFFPKKKKKKSRPVFLNDELRKTKKPE
jgi:uncharacterized membrane protein YidH (DUF202 family)